MKKIKKKRYISNVILNQYLSLHTEYSGLLYLFVNRYLNHRFVNFKGLVRKKIK